MVAVIRTLDGSLGFCYNPGSGSFTQYPHGTLSNGLTVWTRRGSEFIRPACPYRASQFPVISIQVVLYCNTVRTQTLIVQPQNRIVSKFWNNKQHILMKFISKTRTELRFVLIRRSIKEHVFMRVRFVLIIVSN